MYGLINNALKSMIKEEFGTETWLQIVEKAGVGDGSFVSMERYDDNITYQLAGACSDILELPIADCLEVFGHYWISVTAANSYGLLLDSAGGDMLEFLNNVNDLHDRITSTFIGYIPPSFEVDFTDSTIQLIYESKRQGLTPFVLGIIRGLAERYNESIAIGDVQALPSSGGEKSLIPIRLTQS